MRRYGAAREIVVLAELHLVGAGRLARDGRDHLLGHRHQRLVVAVGLVELEHRELGVVLRRDPLVPEVTVDLVDPFDAADAQPLEVELRRDAQEQLHVERVVMRHERAGEGAAGNRLHHRRLDLEIAASVEELPHRGQHAAPHLEDAPRIRVDDQVEVPLPVADLDVGQAVPLFGQRQEALRQELEPGGVNRQLVGPGPEHVAFDADEIAEVEQLEEAEVALAERVLPDVDLHPGLAVGDGEKIRLAEAADRQDAAGRPDVDALGGQGLAAALAIGRHDLADGVRRVELVGVSVDAKLRQRLEVGAALHDLIGLFLVGHSRLRAQGSGSS